MSAFDPKRALRSAIADMPRSQRAAAEEKAAQASGLFILNPKVNGLLLLHIQIAPILTPHLTICAPLHTSFLPTGAPILAPLHADSLGLSL
jgi:hypothetical protein